MDDNTKITLTFEQLKNLLAIDAHLPYYNSRHVIQHHDEDCEEEMLDESFKSALGLSLIAGLLSVGGVLRADEIKAAVPPGASVEQAHRAIDQAGSKTYGGFSAAQAVNILTRTLYDEARGESLRGKRMVATVIWNRAGGNVDNLPGVCLKNKQFSCWNDLTARTPSSFTIKVPVSATRAPEKAKWEECKTIAGEMLARTFKPEGNYTAYYNPAKASPSWGSKMTGIETVDNHKFGYLRSQDGFSKGAPAPTVSTYTVKKDDKGVSYIARDLIRNKKTSYTSTSKLTDKILALNKLKKDKRGNPIIRPGQVLRIPS